MSSNKCPSAHPRDPPANGGKIPNWRGQVAGGDRGDRQQCQRKFKTPEKYIHDLKKQAVEAKDAEGKVAEEERKRKLEACSHQDGPNPLKSVGEVQAAYTYEIAEFFSPMRMIGMAEEDGLKGGWPVDDRCIDPIT